MLTLKDSDCNYSLLKNQVINWKWKLPPLHLWLIRQWFNKHGGGRKTWRGTWRVCTPHPTLTSTFWVCNHFTYFFFLCCVDRCFKEGCGLIAMATTWLHRILLLSSVTQQHQPSNTVWEVCSPYLIMYPVISFITLRD